ncbi:hypothetical protein [Streptomyces sp. GbtcB6]|uniref:hypothetical protein n=1 Tax=Streptomyces sp. GbtcB6 TaxID=2824751 RepID=UPI001C2FC9FA|nr:hypothetical protein [Streptomyces sp. GbtcB6]
MDCWKNKYSSREAAENAFAIHTERRGGGRHVIVHHENCGWHIVPADKAGYYLRPAPRPFHGPPPDFPGECHQCRVQRSGCWQHPRDPEPWRWDQSAWRYVPVECFGPPRCDPCQPMDCHHPACPVRGALELLRTTPES